MMASLLPKKKKKPNLLSEYVQIYLNHDEKLPYKLRQLYYFYLLFFPHFF